MESPFTLIGVLSAVLLGAISPGPSFLVVARTSIAQSRRNGMAAAIGMGLGSVIFAILALLGLKALFSSIPWLYLGLKLIGGIYLVYIGVSVWRGSKGSFHLQTVDHNQEEDWRQSFIRAICTQLSNPKTAIFYGSIFAALLPKTMSPLFLIILPLFILLIEISWYCTVALLLSSEGPRATYLRSKVWIDRVFGGAMGLIGIKLILSADTIS